MRAVHNLAAGIPMNHLFTVLSLLLSLSGCATYQAPGGGVPVVDLAQSGANRDTVNPQPAAPFPARILLVRIQASDYATTGSACFGTGQYCVLTDSNVESTGAMQRLQALPLVAAVDRMPPASIPKSLNTIDELRAAAADLHADLLLLYSLDTRFTVDNADLAPLAVITPGFLPNKGARVTVRTSAVLVDARTGFVYGMAEATSWRDQNAAVWATRATIEDERRITERSSFELWQERFAALWQRVIATHAMRNR